MDNDNSDDWNLFPEENSSAPRAESIAVGDGVDEEELRSKFVFLFRQYFRTMCEALRDCFDPFMGPFLAEADLEAFESEAIVAVESADIANLTEFDSLSTLTATLVRKVVDDVTSAYLSDVIACLPEMTREAVITSTYTQKKDYAIADAVDALVDPLRSGEVIVNESAKLRFAQIVSGFIRFDVIQPASEHYQNLAPNTLPLLEGERVVSASSVLSTINTAAAAVTRLVQAQPSINYAVNPAPRTLHVSSVGGVSAMPPSAESTVSSSAITAVVKAGSYCSSCCCCCQRWQCW